MAAPDHITITVDEEALRKQVRSVLDDSTREFAMRLRHAAHILDPDFDAENAAQLEIHLRGQWEAEQDRVRDTHAAKAAGGFTDGEINAARKAWREVPEDRDVSDIALERRRMRAALAAAAAVRSTDGGQ